MERVKLKTLSVILLLVAFLGSSGIRVKAHTHHEIDFYEIFEDNGTIMLLIDGKTGDILDANKAASFFYKYPVQQLVSMNMSQITGISIEEIERRLAAASNEGKSSLVLEQTTADGERKTVEAYICPHEQDGDTLLFATIFDITEKMELEKRNRQISGILKISLLGAVVFLVLFLITLVQHNRFLRKHSRQVEYLSYHDPLTGLYNRAYYEQVIRKMDTPGNLPLSVIMADVNGLKLTNDIFGHESGDMLLKKAAEIFKKVCKKGDIIARVGGDEFVILMPNTDQRTVEAVVERIRDLFSQEKIKAIKGSISMGVYAKTNKADDINNIMSIAEMKMYSQKSTERGQIKKATINSIVELLHKDNPEERRHAGNVSRISEAIGRVLSLPEMDLRKLKEAGWFHDIGKVILDKSLLNKHGRLLDNLSEEQIRKIRQHPVVGFRILNSFDETLDIAGLILAHHEYWDGSGYPKGLKGEEIPLLARIIAAAEYYDIMVQRNPDTEKIEEELKVQSGKKLDPQLVSILLELHGSI